MDIAINPDSRTVEYCSYFAQDEKIIVRAVMNDIEYKDGLVTIEEEFYEEKKTSIDLEKNFEILRSNNDIFILCEDLQGTSLQAYKLGDFNYLLFSNDYDFCGILLKDISEREWEELQNANCL